MLLESSYHSGWVLKDGRSCWKAEMVARGRAKNNIERKLCRQSIWVEIPKKHLGSAVYSIPIEVRIPSGGVMTDKVGKEYCDCDLEGFLPALWSLCLNKQ